MAVRRARAKPPKKKVEAAGYSGRPLAAKLGIRAGTKVKTRNAPEPYERWLAPLPEGVRISSRLRGGVDLWHLFTTSRSELARVVPRAMREIRPGGMIWVSWPKRASGVTTDVTEDVVREVVLPLGLVDVKVCAVDATWSGLKLVVRKTGR